MSQDNPNRTGLFERERDGKKDWSVRIDESLREELKRLLEMPDEVYINMYTNDYKEEGDNKPRYNLIFKQAGAPRAAATSEPGPPPEDNANGKPADSDDLPF